MFTAVVLQHILEGLAMLCIFLVKSVAHFGEGDLSVGYANCDCQDLLASDIRLHYRV